MDMHRTRPTQEGPCAGDFEVAEGQHTHCSMASLPRFLGGFARRDMRERSGFISKGLLWWALAFMPHTGLPAGGKTDRARHWPVGRDHGQRRAVS